MSRRHEVVETAVSEVLVRGEQTARQLQTLARQIAMQCDRLGDLVAGDQEGTALAGHVAARHDTVLLGQSRTA